MGEYKRPQRTAKDTAEFDQGLAEIDAVIDTFTEAYIMARTIHRKEESLIGLAANINDKADSQEALAQYLAVAIHRIAGFVAERALRTATETKGNT